MEPNRAWLPPTFISLALVAASLFMQYGIVEEFPLFPYFDEVYTVPASRAIATAPETMATDHPPLVPYLMSLSEAVFGDNPTGWRFPSRLCGALTLPAVFLIGLLLTGSIVGPLLGSLALLLDGMFITLSRAALWDTPYVCFGMYAVLVALCAKATSPNRLRYSLLVASGVLAGLSIASKWSGLFFLVPIVFAVVFSEHENRISRRALQSTLVPCTALVAYILITCTLRDLSVQELYAQIVEMFQAHISFPQPHRYASSPWGWPLLARPIWFGYSKLPYMAADGSQAIRGTLCLGNPIVFIFSGLSILTLGAYTLRELLRRKIHLAPTLPLVGYLACWTPWLTLSVRKGFLYYFYPSLVFGCIALGYWASLLNSRSRVGRVIVAACVALIVGCFLAFAPIYLGMPVSSMYMKSLLSFESWW